MDENNQILIYQSDDGDTHIDVKFTGDSVWLTQQQMAELYQTSRTNVVEHIQNIFNEGELLQESTCRNLRQVRTEGNRMVNREMTYYNLDMIISLGYRIKSIIATHFRRWATERLNEYIIKGFAIDDERLKGNGGGAYWKELLDRIRDIRSSEKVMYRQVLDLYATAVDYDPRTNLSIEFFKIVQNKLHYAAHGHTAAEVRIAKNYLSADELKVLNNIVSGYFDFAEIQAMKHIPMYMNDYVKQLDNILSATGEKQLSGSGSVSHKQAIEKAETEYRKFQVRELSPVERAYLETIKALSQKAKRK
jgi:hypothetical protein